MIELICAVAVVLAVGCGDDAPNGTILTSEHFDVHVSPGAPLRPDMIETLEEHYRVNRAFLSFPDGRVTYSLSDPASVERACGQAPMEFPTACCIGNNVYTTNTLDEHELIHAYMSFVAVPAPILQEGIAQGLLCGESYFPVTVEIPPWQTAVSVSPLGQRDIYNAAFFLFVQLVQRFGIDAFMDYYRTAHRTLDAEVFRADFEAFWGVPLDSFWQGLRQSRDGLPKISPLCPCTQTPTLPVDGTRFDIAAREYWMAGDNDLVPPDQVFPLPDSDPGPYMILAGGSTSLRSCWQDRTFDLWGGKLAAPGALTIARLAPERHYVGKTSVDATTIGVTKGQFIAAACDQASVIALPSEASGEIIVRIATGDPVQPAANEWYWKVAVGSSPRVTISPPTTQSTILDVCPSCDQSSPACVSIPSGTDDVVFDATTPELVFHVVNPPDAYYLGIEMTLTNPATNLNPSP